MYQVSEIKQNSKISSESKKLYIESYGCAMNFADSEVILSILSENGYISTNEEKEADVIFINTCSVRDNAEQKIKNRLVQLKFNKKQKPELVVGILGCMAERLKTKLLEEEKLVDVVAGPDSYRDLPNLLNNVNGGNKSINVLLSLEETYAEISPVRINSNGVNAYVSIMRGCDNMCSFCVVPFTRGRERSRDVNSILNEVKQLSENGYKEITLLGQNVDSYLWFGGGPKKDFEKLNDNEKENSVNFAQLLEKVAKIDSNMRIRFSTSYPKDITDEVLFIMKKYNNICKYIHLPAQSGSSRVLDVMNRNYTREWYLGKIDRIREIIPDCGISCDIISGFCTETEQDHIDTLSLMEISQFDFSYMYNYSVRPGTLAERKMTDDVPIDVKKRRLTEIIELQNKISKNKNRQREGKIFRVLVEGPSKRNKNEYMGRSDQNIVVIFNIENYKQGDYVDVLIEKSTTTSLIGKIVEKSDTP
ncbi:MAG: tRNA (N6-isopentenyl adenosine(37)-C2)-methylthiotransferase MiaB [Bacteroidia bacterium]|nr:tRNA (N6-isopentenyl adenosine(37)-C2)-methylthiotransferase MiaB [Bacteroidia bacterium]